MNLVLSNAQSQQQAHLTFSVEGPVRVYLSLCSMLVVLYKRV